MRSKICLAAICVTLFAAAVAPALALDVDAALENELLTGLLKESARIIKAEYGLDGKFGNEMSVIWDDDKEWKEKLGSSTLAVADGNFGFPYMTRLVLNADHFKNELALKGEGLTALRLTVLHEMTHGMQFTSLPGLITFIAEDPTKRSIGKAQFLYEGMAEYAADGNSRTVGFARRRRSQSTPATDKAIAEEILREIKLAMSTSDGVGGYSPTVQGQAEMFYIGSYLATRWFDTQSKKHGGTGVKGLIDYLERHGSTWGENSWVLNEGIKAASNGHWSEYADFANGVMNQENSPQGGFYQFVLSVIREDPSIDAGRIGGYYATGDESKKATREAVARTLGGGARDEAPLKGYGFVSTSIFGRVFQAAPTPPGGDDEEPYVPEPGEHDDAVDESMSSSRWSSSAGGDVTVRVEVDFAKFTGVVSLDGALLAQDQLSPAVSRDFGARSGSTIVTIWEKSLRSRLRRSGEHYVTIGFKDGAASHKLTAAVTPPTPPTDPAPAPTSSGGGCIAGTSALAMLLLLKRRR